MIMSSLVDIGLSLHQRYEKLSVLGEGSSGVTYLARSLQNDEQVALKELSLRACKDWKMLELFDREVALLKRLEHPAIPKYVDSFVADSEGDRQYYLAQTIADGKNLETWIEEGWRCTEADAVDIATQLLEVLVYLQSLDPPVIHRDIKPSNIIRAGDGKLSLVDFGAVGHTYHNTFMKGSTVVGTFGYMAPEQFRGRTLPATDLYSIGATLLFLITRRSPTELPTNQLSIDFRGRVSLSKGFADWLEQLIAPDLNVRYSSAMQALRALKRRSTLLYIPQFNARFNTAPSSLKNLLFLRLSVIAILTVLFANISIRYRYALLSLISDSWPIEYALMTDKLSTADYVAGGGTTSADSPQATALFSAAMKQGNFDLVDQMLAEGLDLSQRDRNGDTPLHTLARLEDSMPLSFLIEYVPDINVDMLNRANETPLQAARAAKSERSAIALILAGADCLEKDDRGISALSTLVHHIQWPHVERLLEAAKICITQIKQDPALSDELTAEVTQLFVQSFENRDTQSVDFLLTEGFELTAERVQLIDFGTVPKEYLPTLAEAVIDVSAQDKLGKSLLHLAAGKGDVDVIQTLLSRGADIDSLSKDGRRPIHHAFPSAREISRIDPTDNQRARSAFWLLVDSGADLQAVPEQYNDVLSRVVSSGSMRLAQRTAAVERLIEKGAPVNFTREDGSTPLHGANYHAEIALILIQAGADVNATTLKDETPLHFARKAEVAAALIEAGADVNATTLKGETALSKIQTLLERENEDRYFRGRLIDKDKKNIERLEKLRDLLIISGAINYQELNDAN